MGTWRTIAVAMAALGSVLAVVAVVFGIGVLRISLADNGNSTGQPPTKSPAPSQLRPQLLLASADADPPADPVPADRTIELSAEKAMLTPRLHLAESRLPPPPHDRHSHKGPAHHPQTSGTLHSIIGWRGPEDAAEWSVSIPRKGAYEVDLIYACAPQNADPASYTLAIGDQQLSGQASGTHGGSENYEMATVGTAQLNPGDTKLRFGLTETPRKSILRIRGVRLVPAQ